MDNRKKSVYFISGKHGIIENKGAQNASRQESAASHLLMNGASLKDVQELLGHKTIEMTMCYAHLSQEHKRNAVNMLNGLIAPLNETVTNCHNDHENQKKEAAGNG